MYMRNKKYDSYALNSFPVNYAGQYSPEELEPSNESNENENHGKNPLAAIETMAHAAPTPQHKEEASEKKSLLGSLLGGGGGEKKGGLLGGLFGKDKNVGFLGGIELEDLILLAVIFFLLKDGFEDDLIIILALILLSG